MKKKLSKKGFTLIELVVVIAILAVLAAILVPSIMGYVTEATQAKDAANARTIYTEYTLAEATGKTYNLDETDCTIEDGDFSCTFDSGTYTAPDFALPE